jgi:hypothetical protein
MVQGTRIAIWLTASVVLGCTFEVGAIAVHDAPAEVPDAGAPEPDAGQAEPPPPFRDDFERPDGQPGGSWRDAARGSPQLWNGELCLDPGEQVETRVPAAAYGYVQLSVFARRGFALHLGGAEGDILDVLWDDGGSMVTAQGVELAPGSSASEMRASHSDVRIELDYANQTARIQVGSDVGTVVRFVSRAKVTALSVLRLSNGFALAAPQFVSMCADDVYVAMARPDEEPFAPPAERALCSPLDPPFGECARRYCCEEHEAARLDHLDVSMVSEMTACLNDSAARSTLFCDGNLVIVQGPLARLADCLDTFCAPGVGREP